MARKDIDAVQITAPDHWHPLMVLEAARQKKHMYCEKPIGWSFRAAQAVRKASKKAALSSSSEPSSGPVVISGARVNWCATEESAG